MTTQLEATGAYVHRARVGVSHGTVEVKLLCFRWLSPSGCGLEVGGQICVPTSFTLGRWNPSIYSEGHTVNPMAGLSLVVAKIPTL